MTKLLNGLRLIKKHLYAKSVRDGMGNICFDVDVFANIMREFDELEDKIKKLKR